MPTAIRPLLWKLRDAPVYLLGTFHLGPPDGYSLGQNFADVFAASTTLICEMGPRDKVFDPALLRRTSGRLAEEIGPDLYARLRTDSRYDASFETMHPVIVIVNLAMRLYTDVGLTPAQGLDSTLERQALAAGKTCGGFETATDQLTAMVTIDNTSLVRAFDFMITKPEWMLEIRDLVIRSMINGDEAGIRAARKLTAQWSTTLAAKILSEREARWLPRLLALAAENVPALVAVGALHLAGPDGLIDRLAASGISTDRVEA